MSENWPWLVVRLWVLELCAFTDSACRVRRASLIKLCKELIDWMNGRSFDWLFDWLIDWLIDFTFARSAVVFPFFSPWFNRMWPEYVRTRIRSTYSYLGVTLGVTAASAYLVARVRLFSRIFLPDRMLRIIPTNKSSGQIQHAFISPFLESSNDEYADEDRMDVHDRHNGLVDRNWHVGAVHPVTSTHSSHSSHRAQIISNSWFFSSKYV